jgi:hypothetical protein
VEKTTQYQNKFHNCVISGFSRCVNDICALVGLYAA